ncbi:MAG: EAL domain-containing protein [Acidobacteriota bacterium]
MDVNEKACEMYGIKRKDFIGRSIKEISQDAGRSEIHLRELSEKGINQSFETVQFRADGTPINLFINSSMIEYQGRPLVLSINRDITERKRAEEELLHNALHDALTGLPNRALFLEHLRHAIERNGMRGKKIFAVLFLDFDHFKVINDSLGHMEGDNLLRLIAKRLTHSLRPGDIVARLGGDEFTILLDDLGDSGDVLQIVERIQTDLKQPFNLRGNEVFTSASIGIALSDANYTEPEIMLRDADIAMYRAKANGKACHQIFNHTMHEQASSRLQLETELRQAVEHEEFRVYYQPIINLQSDEIKGFESLVRWQHPTRGIVSPLEFIPVAEETGLIIPLGEWILRESCRQLSAWQSEFKMNPPLTMSVNLSCKQFVQTDLVERIVEIIRDTKIEASSLRLEITESHLMKDSEAAILIMNNLRALGIKLSIDDFGTGYSSLSYLHRLPINYLKVDRSFVSQMQENSENREIVRTIILLAKNLNLEVIAEGIETIEQAQYLKSLTCNFGQGYLYSKPVDAPSATKLLFEENFSNSKTRIIISDFAADLINDVAH